MIIDGNLLFSNGQAITATADSTNILDFGVIEDLGVSERPLQVFVDWTTAPVGSSPGTTTVQYTLETSSTGTSGWINLLTAPATLTTGITAGTVNPFDLPQGCSRYLKLNYAVASGSLTAGSVTAGLNLDTDGGQRYYKRGYLA